MIGRYSLVNPNGKEVARGTKATLLVDAAAARAVVNRATHGTEAEWRVYFVPGAHGTGRKLRYGISIKYGVWEIDGSGVPSTVAINLDSWLARRSVDPTAIPADATGYSPEDSKHPIWQDGGPV